MADFSAWLIQKNTEAYNQYLGPRLKMTCGKTFAEFTEFLCKDETKDSMKSMLAYLSLGTDISEDLRNGEVGDRAVLYFAAAYTIAYYPNEEFFLTTKDLPDNAELTLKARTMLSYFEQVPDCFGLHSKILRRSDLSVGRSWCCSRRGATPSWATLRWLPRTSSGSSASGSSGTGCA